MKKVGIYDPYLAILGGAERYILNIAMCLSSEYEIILFGDDSLVIKKAAEKFGLMLPSITLIPWPKNRRSRMAQLKKLDLFFYITDGSLFISPAKKNILIIQSPAHTPIKTLTNRIKLFSWHRLIVYSSFMAEIVRKRLGREVSQLFVPVSQPQKITKPRKNLIISVGRFFTELHNKKQLEMVTMFKTFLKRGMKAELCLVGSINPGSEAYYKQVAETAKGFPITIKTDVSFDELDVLYAQAKVYWHAAGLGEDLQKYPERAEHFGVVTLEAAIRGAVPVVFKAGGQPELVIHNKTGFLWNSSDELFEYTQELLTDSDKWMTFSKYTKQHATKYSITAFCQRLHEII